MYRTIIVGYDGTERSEDALALGCRFAAASAGRLILAFVDAGKSLGAEIRSAAPWAT